MATFGGGEMVLLMLTGVTVVIITLRLMARADRIKEQASAEQPIATVRRPADEGTPRREAARNSARSQEISSSVEPIPVAEPARRIATDVAHVHHLRRA